MFYLKAAIVALIAYEYFKFVRKLAKNLKP